MRRELHLAIHEMHHLECTRPARRKETGHCGTLPPRVGADIICLQETMLTHLDQRTWTSLGWGSSESHVAIAASGRSGGILLAWKETIFDRAET